MSLNSLVEEYLGRVDMDEKNKKLEAIYDRYYDRYVESIAELAHNINKAYCVAIGDNSQEFWSDAPDWQKNSAINGVHFIIENPSATSEDTHNSWLKQKVAEGWVYGDAKDAEKKTHHCIKPYAELPESQRVKDGLFKAAVMGAMKILDYWS